MVDVTDLAGRCMTAAWPKSLPRPPVEKFGYAGGDFIDRAVTLVLSLDRTAPGRFVAFYWEPLGDELAWIDDRGCTSVGLGNNWAWIRWRNELPFAAGDERLESSEEPGVHVILWDRATNRIYVALRDHVEDWFAARQGGEHV